MQAFQGVTHAVCTVQWSIGFGIYGRRSAHWLSQRSMEALASGDADQHDRLIAETAPRLAHCDVVMLAQCSMARALPAVHMALGERC